MAPDTKKPDAPKIDIIPTVTKIAGDTKPGASADAAREELEQRRTILQNMKDFDFQIKKNQEDITNMSEKVENLSKDLDDLVSLYEIVSEQMNPFVGLSKVTKKRLDALENFTKEVDGVKTRIGEIESVLEKTGVNLGTGSVAVAPKTTTPKPDIPKAPTTQPMPTSPQPPVVQPATVPVPTTKTTIPLSTSPLPQLGPIMIGQNLSETELDELLSRSLESLVIDQNIENMINEFIISLK